MGTTDTHENKTVIEAVQRLIDKAQKGWDSVETDGWISEEDTYRLLGIAN